MNRRKFLAAMAAGAILTAEGLWIPGAKLISIPKPALHYTFSHIADSLSVLKYYKHSTGTYYDKNNILKFTTPLGDNWLDQ